MSDTCVGTGVWRDLAADGISCAGRMLFVYLATSPTMSIAGVDTVVIDRWVYATGLPATELDDALVELESADLVIVDRDSAELYCPAVQSWNRSRLYGHSVREFLGPVMSQRIRTAALGARRA